MNKWIPMRTCIVCRKNLPKSDLIRIVKTKDGEIMPDPTGKASGRGCYVCKEGCGSVFIKKKAANRAFKTNVGEEVYERLKEFFEN